MNKIKRFGIALCIAGMLALSAQRVEAGYTVCTDQYCTSFGSYMVWSWSYFQFLTCDWQYTQWFNGGYSYFDTCGGDSSWLGF